MSRGSARTQKQGIELLQISALLTRADYLTLLGYIFEDPKNKEQVASRKRSVRRFYKKYIGARIKILVHPEFAGCYGTVRYVRIRSKQERINVKAMYGIDNPSLYVFVVDIEGDEDISIQVPPLRTKIDTSVSKRKSLF